MSRQPQGQSSRESCILEYTVYATDTNSSVTLVNTTTVQAVYHLCDSLFTQDHVYKLHDCGSC